MTTLLEVDDLHTVIRQRRSVVRAVDGVSLTVGAGETVGLVGESGCGKTITGRSILRLLPPGGHIVSGEIRLEGRNLATLPEEDIRRIRGNEVALVFQDPMTSLNPTMTIGDQIGEHFRYHRGTSKREATERAHEMLALVGVPNPAERLENYPHQLSGGLRQRAMIAIALACGPKLLIADEPTTALDVTIQSQILALLAELKERLGMGVLLITHDMGVIAGQADRVAVMYAGQVVETAATSELFAQPRHPYTAALLDAIPQLDQDPARRLFSIPGSPPDLSDPPPGCRFASRCLHATEECRDSAPALTGPDGHSYACFHPLVGRRDRPAVEAVVGEAALGSAVIAEPQAHQSESRAGRGRGEISYAPSDGEGPAPIPVLVVEHLVREFPVTRGVLQRRIGTVKAVSDVSFSVGRGETFGLVGESGSGKTTIGRCIVALESADSGSVMFDGVDVGNLKGRRSRGIHRQLQLMFQDPYASLDPRMRIGSTLREPLAIQGIGDRQSRQERIEQLLSEVGLRPAAASLYPHEFSGGQRQRIGFARALTVEPRLIVADEPVSALDVSIRSQILNLMKELQRSYDLTYIVISHDLSVVHYLADRIGVLYLGKLVEVGSRDEIYERPVHPYTAGLLEAIPVPNPAVERTKSDPAVAGELPSALTPPSGCRFHTRCPRATEQCVLEEPPMRSYGPDHVAACHHPLVLQVDTVTTIR